MLKLSFDLAHRHVRFMATSSVDDFLLLIAYKYPVYLLPMQFYMSGFSDFMIAFVSFGEKQI
jgi:hypothetical protein